MKGDIRVTRVETHRELASALEIRKEVFVLEQGIPAELDNDGKDGDALHVLVYAGGRAVATGRVVVSGTGEAVLARIAVRREHRNRGLGRRVVRELEALGAEGGARTFRLHPHHYLERFYEGLGYRTVGEGGSVGGHRLIGMVKQAGSPREGEGRPQAGSLHPTKRSYF